MNVRLGNPGMHSQNEFSSRKSLIVLLVALTYSGYVYFSGDFWGLGFVLRLVKNPLAYAWPTLRVFFVVQVLLMVATFATWRQDRVLRWISLSSICLAVLTQAVLLISCVSLQFDPRVKMGWLALSITTLIAFFLVACLVVSLTQRKPAKSGKDRNC